MCYDFYVNNFITFFTFRKGSNFIRNSTYSLIFYSNFYQYTFILLSQPLPSNKPHKHASYSPFDMREPYNNKFSPLSTSYFYKKCSLPSLSLYTFHSYLSHDKPYNRLHHLPYSCFLPAVTLLSVTCPSFVVTFLDALSLL